MKGANASTGCSMISMDRQNPKTIFAGMWDFRRKGWTFRSGGESGSAPSGSGLFKSSDGGATWTELDASSAQGLPAKPWGRVAVSVAPSKPNVVYAVIEAEIPKDGLYRSDDGGKTWTALDRSQAMIWRPFYFSHLIVDPKDENKVYKPNLPLIASNDGGKSFSNITGGTHGDHHDLWINPNNTDHLIAGDDGGIWIVDDITPLRAMTPETLAKDAVFIAARPTVQSVSGGGGWSNGDAAFVGPNPPGDAVITYYQRKRHIFGDLKIEVFDSEGQSLGAIPSSKRRGLSRATWSMRLKPPKVPTAATAAFGAAYGPRVLPGVYTVKMTKDKQVYTTQLQVVPDPRAKHSADDRKAQFDLAMKVYKLLGEMSFTVERINNARLTLEARALQLAPEDPLRKQLQTAAAQADEQRKKIVATKEGGAITGEERLREYLAGLYSNVVFYEGRPSQTQVERADALARELADIVKDFSAWEAKELSSLNSVLEKRRLELIKPLTREEWEKKGERE